ncbi:polyhydroxyalkanoic acid system family protein [Myxococcota bacterium]|nr:polyhydroxyalkanoic acid system family protein [Myxococcota bacterium]
MSTIRLTQKHDLPPEEALKVFERFEGEISKYGVKLSWVGLRAEVKGMGVSGDAEVRPGEVALTLKLGMLAKAAGVDPARLEASLAKRFKAAFEGGTT